MSLNPGALPPFTRMPLAATPIGVYGGIPASAVHACERGPGPQLVPPLHPFPGVPLHPFSVSVRMCLPRDCNAVQSHAGIYQYVRLRMSRGGLQWSFRRRVTGKAICVTLRQVKHEVTGSRTLVARSQRHVDRIGEVAHGAS